MPNHYTNVRRRWKDTDIEKRLAALWTKERFEDASAVEEALHVYELAIRVEGWDTVKNWARAHLKDGRVLNAQLVELAMRALEQSDSEFVQEITQHLLNHAAPSYFRFWHTLFATRHAHQGERIFRAQLAALSDFHVIKYRRLLRRILRKLRFRCKTAHERAVGAMVFAMYKEYDASAYPSQVFQAYLACHDAARTRKKTKQGKPVSKKQQMIEFAQAASELGIWTVTEGIRTSARLPRTLGYLAAMAPKMTDRELMRALRAFDGMLETADHKRASEEVVELATYLKARLSGMDVAVEEWSKIYPYQKSPVLVRVFEELMGNGLDAASAQLELAIAANAADPPVFVPIVPATLEGRAFRAAFLSSYLLYRQSAHTTAFLVDAARVRALSPITALWPHGYGVQPPAWRWQARPDQPHRIACAVCKETFPQAATRRRSSPMGMEPYIRALRYHLYRRAVLDHTVCAKDVPVLFLIAPPDTDERKALRAHLDMFSAAMLVLFDRPWTQPLDAPHVVHATVSTHVTECLQAVAGYTRDLVASHAAFSERESAVEQEIRHLQLGPPPSVEHISQGPYRTA